MVDDTRLTLGRALRPLQRMLPYWSEQELKSSDPQINLLWAVVEQAIVEVVTGKGDTRPLANGCPTARWFLHDRKLIEPFLDTLELDHAYLLRYIRQLKRQFA